MQMLIDILRASGRAELLERGYDKLKTYGAGRDPLIRNGRSTFYQMIQLGYMEIDYAARACLADDPVRQACPVRGAKGPARHLSGTG